MWRRRPLHPRLLHRKLLRPKRHHKQLRTERLQRRKHRLPSRQPDGGGLPDSATIRHLLIPRQWKPATRSFHRIARFATGRMQKAEKRGRTYSGR